MSDVFRLRCECGSAALTIRRTKEGCIAVGHFREYNLGRIDGKPWSTSRAVKEPVLLDAGFLDACRTGRAGATLKTLAVVCPRAGCHLTGYVEYRQLARWLATSPLTARPFDSAVSDLLAPLHSTKPIEGGAPALVERILDAVAHNV